MALTLKVAFPPGHPAAHSMIKVEPNATCEETLNSIAQKQNIANPEQYLLYLPAPTPMWLEKGAAMKSYPIKDQGNLEIKRKHQLVRISRSVPTHTTHTLLVDITRPLQEFMRWVAVKFLIDEDEIKSWALYNSKGTELNLQQSLKQQSAESSFQFALAKKGDSTDSPSSSPPASPPHFLSLDGDDKPTNGSKADKDDDSENPELHIAAKSLTNPQKEGYLKKMTTKKDWKKRYFILKDKSLYYFSSPQDRKASGMISMIHYAAKPTNLQAKEAKYWAFELYPLKPPLKSPRKDSKEKESSTPVFIIKCESEQEMHGWLAALRGDNTPKLISVPTPTKNVKGKPGAPGPAVFGVDLAISVPYGAGLPNIVEQAIKYVDEKALDAVGIYRLSGSAPTIANWKKLFDKGEKVDLTQEPDPHAVAGLLKLFFRELPEPVLTFAKYDDFIAAISQPTKWAKVKAVKAVAQSITGVNRSILLALLQHLRRVNARCEINKMHLANLATVFGPGMLRKPSSGPPSTDGGFDATVLEMVVDTPAINELFMCLVEDYEYIFGDKVIPQSAIFARALYAYNGEGQNTEMSFEAGSIVRITQIGEKDAWWMGQILLSPTPSFIGKYTLMSRMYVELVPGTSADWISLAALYTLTEDVEANRGKILTLQGKFDALSKDQAASVKAKEAAASQGEKNQKAIAEAVGVNPQLGRLWEHMDELVKNLSLYTKSTSVAEVEQYRHTLVEEVEQLTGGKFKNKGDKEAFVAKLEAIKASLEAERASRAKVSLTSNIVLKDIEFLKNMLK